MVVDHVEATTTSSTTTVDGSCSLDTGDGRNNELVDSCPYFRNEIGGELPRTLAFCQQRLHPKSAGQPRQYLVRSAECNGVSVLDCSPASDGSVEPPLLLHNSLIVEYVDRGATYYRRFFYDHGTALTYRFTRIPNNNNNN